MLYNSFMSMQGIIIFVVIQNKMETVLKIKSIQQNA